MAERKKLLITGAAGQDWDGAAQASEKPIRFSVDVSLSDSGRPGREGRGGGFGYFQF